MRERKEDILILSKHFLSESSSASSNVEISEEAKAKLLNHSYPGNVRELKSVIELAAVMCDDDEIRAKDITFMGGDSLSSILLEKMTLKEMNRRIILQCLELGEKADEDE